jgi:hypothetical protein
MDTSSIGQTTLVANSAPISPHDGKTFENLLKEVHDVAQFSS